MVATDRPPPAVRLGLKENLGQFTLLVVINAFVGGMVGLERAVLPVLAVEQFALASTSAVLSFLVSFGLVKAVANLMAGTLADWVGRRSILVAGWLAGLPVPFLIMAAPRWSWVVAANLFLGLNQGLCWSATVIMKIDLVGPRQRGLATGLNEFAGYLAVGLAALGSGFLAARYGLRPVTFHPAIAFAIMGLVLSIFFLRDTTEHARLESRLTQVPRNSGFRPGFAKVFALTTWRDRSLFSASQAGLVNNVNDAIVWGLVPLALARQGLSVSRIGVIAATYPAVWGIAQLATGPLSDAWGRKWMIASGMWVQALGIGLFVLGTSFGWWITAGLLLGIGTALVYPTLLAAVSDVAHPAWRASAVGVYRLWRDGGYAVGGLGAGLLADNLGSSATIVAVGALTALSGVVVAVLMRPVLTHPIRWTGGATR